MTIARQDIDKYVSKELQSLLSQDEVTLLFLVRQVKERGEGKFEGKVQAGKLFYVHQTFGHSIPPTVDKKNQ